MAQGTQKTLGGTPYKRYPDPASPGTANAQGLYPWSVFTAPICDYNGADIPTVVAELSNVPVVYLLLFTSDIPATLELRATDTANNLQFSAPGTVNDLTFPYLYTTPGQNGTPATIPIQGKVISGYTGPQGDVYCTGFPASGNVTAPGSGTDFYTEVICIANGPVISAPVSSLSLGYKQNNNNGFAPVPVIIRWDSYTAALRDGGNLITANDGSLYQIVGLWAPA